MAENFCCEGVVLNFGITVPPVSGSIAVNPEVFPPYPAAASILSSKVKTGGNRVYTKIGFTITGATNGTCTQTVPYYGSITGTAVKCRVDGSEIPVRETDNISALITGQTGGGSPCTISATIEIQSPGQIKAKGV